MHDVVLVAVVERAADLPRELARDALAQAAVADDVVEHLPAAHVLEDHVVVVLVHDHLSHAADVRVVEEHRQRGLAERPDLLRGVLVRLLLGGLGRGRDGTRARSHAGEDLDRELRGMGRSLHISADDGNRTQVTEGGGKPRNTVAGDETGRQVSMQEKRARGRTRWA